jgi:predicted HTH transcriptional regulator
MRIAMGESRNQEFKETMNWIDDNTKFSITKAILAMSNTRNGGNIFIGIKETEEKRFLDEGMTESDYNSFNPDHVKDYISRYADPPARIDLQKVNFSEKNFIIINVPEFEEYPVICKKAYDLGGKIMLENGAICVRTVAGKPQSSKVISHVDMREIINLSTEKRIKEISRLLDIAISPSQEEVDESKFEEQINDF